MAEDPLALLDFRASCDWAGCGDPAIWFGLLSCCGAPTLRCQMHRIVMDAIMRSVTLVAHVSGEGHCGGQVRGVRWDVLSG